MDCMDVMEQMKQKIVKEVDENGEAILWKGTLHDYIKSLQEEENEFDLPGDTPVQVCVLRNEKGKLALLLVFNPDTENESYIKLGDENTFMTGLEGVPNADSGFWMMVSAHLDESNL